jgi:hypothetical protein
MERDAMTRTMAIFLMVVLMSGCRSDEDPPSEPALSMLKLEPDAGIAFVHRSGHDGMHLLPEAVGSGVGVLDVNADGWLDIVLIQGADASGSQLFLNRGASATPGHRFDPGQTLGGPDRFGMGLATGDVDADGDLDLYITALGPDMLYRNNGDGTLTDITIASGLGQTGFGAGATFFDADRDGDLDLFVANYVDWTPELERPCRNAQGEPDYCPPADYGRPSVDRLYRNDGGGHFTDVTDAAGLADAAGTGLGVLAADFDGDGLDDLFVANDGMPDRLWRNLGDLRFEEVGLQLGCAVDNTGTAKAGMGVSVLDLDSDGDLDLLVGNLSGETDSLFRNEGTFFRDITAVSGLATVPRAYTRFGLGFADLDNDGWPDLAEFNGRVARVPRIWSQDPYAEPDVLLRGTADGRFEFIQPDWPAASSRGAAFADLNNDGRMDVVVNNRDAAPHILMNAQSAPWRGVLLDIRDQQGSPAIGAVVQVTVEGKTRRHDVRTDGSYLSANDARVHVGLGEASHIEQVLVTWPDGTTRTFRGLSPGEVQLLRP